MSEVPVGSREGGKVGSREQRFGRSESTRGIYQARWGVFRAWCEGAGCAALPTTAETLQLYINWALTTRRNRLKTVALTLAAIADRHRHEGYRSPVTRELNEYLQASAGTTKEQQCREVVALAPAPADQSQRENTTTSLQKDSSSRASRARDRAELRARAEPFAHAVRKESGVTMQCAERLLRDSDELSATELALLVLVRSLRERVETLETALQPGKPEVGSQLASRVSPRKRRQRSPGDEVAVNHRNV